MGVSGKSGFAPSDIADHAASVGEPRGSRDDIAGLIDTVVVLLEKVGPGAGPDGLEALEAARRVAELVREGSGVPEMPGKVETQRRVRETVLVVDDNAGVRRLVVRQLHEMGYRAIEAEDGPTALMALNGGSVDLLFTDVVMPGGMSGFDLARLVLSRWPQMKALITSGFPELEPQGDSAAQAKLKRLIKPYRKADLERALREVLDC